MKTHKSSWVVGIDVGGTKIEGIALGEHGAELLRRRIPTPRDDYRQTLAAIGSQKAVEPLLARVGAEACVVFHCVQIGAGGDGTLEALARLTGGEYLRVDG